MNEAIVEDIIIKVIEEFTGNVNMKAACDCDDTTNSIPVELSARHVHLSEEHIQELFGEPLVFKKELSQPGQFLSKQRLRLIGPKSVINNVAVLGPARPSSQVEISLTDAKLLGVAAHVGQSGEIEGTPGIIMASTDSIVGLEEGVLVAGRHIHMPTSDARRFGVRDKEMVSVHLDTERPVIMENVLVRTSDDFKLAMHIDFDEGNGSAWKNGVTGKIVKGCREL